MPPMFADSEDRQIALLEQIAENLGGIQSAASTSRRPVGGAGYQPSSLLVTETAAVDDANDDGTITVKPGQERTIVEWETTGDRADVLALGASDAADAVFSLYIDGEIKIQTLSPLGTITNPFSFVEKIGSAYQGGQSVSYRVTLLDGAAAAVDFAGRLFVDEVAE